MSIRIVASCSFFPFLPPRVIYAVVAVAALIIIIIAVAFVVIGSSMVSFAGESGGNNVE